jgi:hypothetical protein
MALGKDPLTKPAHGRVNGAGLNAKWETYYPEDRELARQRRRAGRVIWEEKMAQMKAEALAEARAEARAEAAAQAQVQVAGMLPSIIAAVKQSIASGETPNINFPPLVDKSAAPNVSSEKEPLIAPHSSPSVSFLGHRSSPADIDALTVSVVGSTNTFFHAWFRCSDL